MPKKIHPADIAARKQIATATHFNVHLRRNPGDVSNTEAATLIEAVKIADGMGTEKNGKKPMIYAVTPDRQSVFVPADVIDEARKDAAEIAAGLSGTEIAKLTAIITGGGFKRANSKAAAEARFIKIATEAGIASAADIVRGPYDMAEHVIREKLAGKALTIAEVKSGLSPDTETLARDAVYDAAFEQDAPLTKSGAMEALTDAVGDEAANAYVEQNIKEFSALPDGDPSSKPAKSSGKRAAILEAAQRGEIPDAPDFSAPTHSRFRKKLAEIVTLAEAGDVAGLKAIAINPVSSSPKAMAKYRDLAVIAIEARQKKAA